MLLSFTAHANCMNMLERAGDGYRLLQEAKLAGDFRVVDDSCRIATTDLGSIAVVTFVGKDGVEIKYYACKLNGSAPWALSVGRQNPQYCNSLFSSW